MISALGRSRVVVVGVGVGSGEAGYVMHGVGVGPVG
jgi:hypothetical protein